MSQRDDALIVINTDALIPPATSGGLWENRAGAYYMYDAPGVPKCTIAVTAYNRLDKTRYCVECILHYTQDVDYELLLIDNGSEDGTYEYFQSVPYERKRILKITKNIGLGYAWSAATKAFQGKYLVLVSNDVYVTRNWLSNLLKCYESDPRIGFALPVSSNISNFQEVNLQYCDRDDMQRKAAAFNQSDPMKWEERMRLISLISIFSRPVLDIVGINDPAYLHDFLEDDLAVRLRRAGYKLMLCRDTWVCHDHDFRNMENKDPAAFQESLASGRRIYQEKYHGLDAWDDINNFEHALLAPLDTMEAGEGDLSALTVDARCGTPVLEIRNRLRRRGIGASSYAFTTQAKYFADLQSVTEQVVCDRIDFIQSAYADNMFDIAALCEPINLYPAPITLLQQLYHFLKPGGMLLFKLRNTDDFNALLRSGGLGGRSDPDLPSSLPIDQVMECLRLFGARDVAISIEPEYLSAADQDTIRKLLRGLKPNADENDFARLIAKNYVFMAVKG